MDIIQSQWVAAFSWQFWIESSTPLLHSHAPIARDYVSLRLGDNMDNVQQIENANAQQDARSEHSAITKVSVQFSEHLSRLVIRIRIKQYSIRTEQAYKNWLARYIFITCRIWGKLAGSSVKAFLEFLVVEQHISASTQSQALCALVFFYKQVLNVDLGEFGQFTHSKNLDAYPLFLPLLKLPLCYQ